MLWMIMCIDDGDKKHIRGALHAEHSKYLDDNADILFFSGPQQSDDASTNEGSLFIVNTPSRAEAENFVNNETFCRAGVFKEIRIRRLRKGRYFPENLEKSS